jgi:preprotein translocase subunit SecD
VPPAKRSNPGRALIFVLIVVVALFGGMFLSGTHSPALGLDLRGGTTVTLKPRELVKGATIKKSDLNTAVSIMRNRVNGLGVGNADVKIEGDNIVVSVPGKDTQGVLNNIGETAQLSIREVYQSSRGAAPTPTTPAPSTSPAPSSAPSSAPSGAPSSAPASPQSMGSPDDAGVAIQPASFVRAAGDSPAPSNAPSTAPSSAPSTAPSPAPSSDQKETTPSAAELAAYDKLDCSKPLNEDTKPEDEPNKFMVTCGAANTDTAGIKYLLYPTLIQGKELSSAQAQFDTQGTSGWTVQLKMKSGAQSTWAKFTAANIGKQTAIVLDSEVLSDPQIQSAIVGDTQITGNFTHKDASALANALKYGALPLAFDQQTAQTISATLGSSELHAGLLAGAIGLILVLLYSFFYYRGLSIVTLTSLALSAAIQYPIIVLLGKGIGYTLTLAGIAGLIVAIGVTADSFIVFFERLRDEVREGNTLRSAVEKGWVRARRTIVSADLVSLIAAVILYWLAIGDVRGFAFTLGLSTIVDLFIVFYFTKPLVTLLSRTKFFGEGHKLSGLDPEHLGVDKLRVTTTATRRPASARKV